MQKLNMKSPDLTAQNVDRITELFPEVSTETAGEDGKLKKAIDFDLLKQLLSDELVEGEKERYQLTWPGKKEAILNANTPIDKTLRPVKEDSVNWDTTENLYIEGDNLEVLKLLQESYLGKVKCIYIDPPYNTGKDFVYRDDFSESSEEYLEGSGQVGEDGERLFRNTETNGRFHSDWLSMIYSRLKTSRNLLHQEGSILVHIDENEVVNLKKALDEIYGIDNFLGEIIWDKGNPKGDATSIAYQHEILLAYAKSKSDFISKNPLTRDKTNASKIIAKAKDLFLKIGKKELPSDLREVVQSHNLSVHQFEEHKIKSTIENVNKEFYKWIKNQSFSGGEAAYCNIDSDGEVYRPVSMAWPNKKKAPDDYFIPLIHPETKKPCSLPERGWRNPSSTMKRLLADGKIIFGKDETTIPNRKYLLKENMKENVPSLLYFAGSDDALFKSLKINFDNPKPYKFSKQLMNYFAFSSDSLILDFFSGSATTAHAVMQLNAEDGGNRKYIMVQLPEQTPETSEARKAGYATICEIGKERIRRAAKKIQAETGADIDYGFRVYRVDFSNMKDIYYTPDKLGQGDLLDLTDNIKGDRTGEDLLIQVMLEKGLLLSLPMESREIDGFTFHYVAGNSLIACFDTDIPEALIRRIAAEDKPLRFICRDASFADDSDRINLEEIFKLLSPSTDIQVL
ncbi:site-specific DNA-methyltransferase [Saccharibacillus sp. CPCC 101409]|uniref:site-specific DNA-methyltransferase n=1 Tax=Saccharibacillus sp. CPCC 101409 TaxID=3058041 RepID=UPI0026734EF1|nr:site-specific DNA-methyltransferase [Saccharibacillus sp. CPCC 101409]MDO3409897.1 site-specific DNA-methyltransferase [Saccharibacillus sp. CPCC 101409]